MALLLNRYSRSRKRLRVLAARSNSPSRKRFKATSLDALDLPGIFTMSFYKKDISPNVGFRAEHRTTTSPLSTLHRDLASSLPTSDPFGALQSSSEEVSPSNSPPPTVIPPPACPSISGARRVVPAFLPDFPTVHRAKPDDLTANIDPEQRMVWLHQPPSTSAAVQVYGVRDLSPDEVVIVVAVLKRAISSVTGCATVEVSVPIAARNSGEDKAHSMPSSFLAFNLTTTAAAMLKKRVCWVTNECAFFAYNLSPSIPTYLFSMQGFTHKYPDKIRESVLAVVLSSPYRDISLALAQSNEKYRGYSSDAIMTSLTSSIKVSILHLSMIGPVIANIYCDSPTENPELWCVWRDAFLNAEYGGGLYGRGSPMAITVAQCSGCHGADHPREVCPFSRFLGWHDSS